MPDDRELLDTGTRTAAGDRFPGRRPPTRRHGHRPAPSSATTSWPRGRWASSSGSPSAGSALVVLPAVLANLLPLPEPQLPELHRAQPGPEHAPTGSAPTTSAATCCPGWSSAPGSRSSSGSSAWPSAWCSAAPPAWSRATAGAGSTSPSTPSPSSSWPSPPSWPSSPSSPSGARPCSTSRSSSASATIPLMFRVIRASSLSFAQRDFVRGGQDHGRHRHPDPAPRDPAQRHPGVIVTFSLIAVAGLIVIEGTLAFLGLSVAPAHAVAGAT